MDTAFPNHFDKAASTWDEKPLRVNLANAIGETILREVELSKEIDVLDYGCGTGLLSLFLLPHVRSVTGADSSTGMLDVLNRKIDEIKLTGMKTLHLDLDQDSIPKDRFDLITTSMTMHHVRDTDMVLKAFYQLLHPGGIICIADLDSEPGTFHGADTAESVHHHGFDRIELSERLKKVGFTEIRDVTAHVISKETDENTVNEYPVFLMVAKKRA